MSTIFKPHRGRSSVMSNQKKNIVLEAGEMFIELPDSGTSNCKMKIGDGNSTYENLPYAMTGNNIFIGATSNLNGTSGNVPIPTAGQENAVLKGDGSWDTDVVNSMAFKNLIPTEFYTSRTSSGLTFVYNDDGSFTLNGTTTSQKGINLTTSWFCDATIFKKYLGKEVTFFCENDNSNLKLGIRFFDANNDAILTIESKKSAVIPVTTEKFSIYTYIPTGITFSNEHFRPILMLSDDIKFIVDIPRFNYNSETSTLEIFTS